MNYLFDRIEKILRRLRVAKRIFFFLDYDGTLTPIVSHPEEAYLSEEMKRVLLALKKIPKVRLSIVSGRSLKDIRNRVGLKGIFYIGNHGLEIFEPQKGRKPLFDEEVVPELKRIRDRLDQKLRGIEGTIIEDKGYVLAIHYRNVDPRWVPSMLMAIKQEIQNVLVPLYLDFGKYVFEVRPKSTVNKGTVVLDLLSKANQNGMVPVYIGDDRTDEDVFRALKRGVTIFVGMPEPVAFSARYYVKDPSEVYEFLKMIQKDLHCNLYPRICELN